jgi:hypothetical protein
MTHTVQFLLTLVASVVISTVGLVQAHEAEIMGEKLIGLLVLVGLPLVLGSWFRRLRSEDPPIWWELRQHLAGVTGERLPVLEPNRANLFFPLPWFLLPMILVFGSVGLATEYRALLSVPIVATVGWIGLISVYVVWWILSHRSAAASGLQRMLADFGQGPPAGGMVSPDGWAGAIFDRHRPTMEETTLEALYRAGLKDALGNADRWPGFEVTRLHPLYARQGWLCILEDQGLIPRDDSRHSIHTDVPEVRQGWQCPRCHTVNEPDARRCTLSAWDMTPLCRERRPGLRRVAELAFTIVEFAMLLVFLVLFFGPLLLAVLFIYGVLTMLGNGDSTGLLATTALAAVWLVGIRLPMTIARDARESLEMFVGVFGLLPLLPFMMLANALHSIFRGASPAQKKVEIVFDGSTLVIRPRIVRPGKINLRVLNKDSDAEVSIAVVRTDLRLSALPADLETYLAGRPNDAVLVDKTWVAPGESERRDLSLMPGRCVIAATTGPGEVGRDVRIRNTLIVGSAA